MVLYFLSVEVIEKSCVVHLSLLFPVVLMTFGHGWCVLLLGCITYRPTLVVWCVFLLLRCINYFPCRTFVVWLCWLCWAAAFTIGRFDSGRHLLFFHIPGVWVGVCVLLLGCCGLLPRYVVMVAL